jgi:succinyl-CoA synthetase beta subunit
MDIESVSQETPHLIKTIPVDILVGVTDRMAESIADFLQFEGSLKVKVIIHAIALLCLEYGRKK